MKTVAFLFCLAFALVSFEAQAKSTAFLCLTEQSANEIAAKVVVSQSEADNVAAPYIVAGVCVYLPQAVDITIVSYGPIYGTGSFKVQVVGIAHKEGDTPDFWALMRLEEGSA